MTIFEIVRMYNEDGLSLSEIGDKIGKSKSTVQRMLTSNGWHYDKVNKKYLNVSNNISNNISNNTIVTVSNNNLNQSNNNNSIKIVNRTYGIPSDIDRALKIMCALEGRNAVDIVREALRNSIDEKYFNYK